MALLVACALPVVSAAGRQLNGFEFVQTALRGSLTAEPLRAALLTGAVAANLIVPLCTMLVLAGRGHRYVPWLCAASLLPALVLAVQALASQVVTLHLGAAVWFSAMFFLCAVALWR